MRPLTSVWADRRTRGFTLVEVLLALALLAMLLVALNVFLFSMSELWGENIQQRLFDQHVRAVTRRLGEIVQRGVRMPVAEHALRIEAPPGAGNARLSFDLPTGDRLLPWPEAPLPDVACSLVCVPERGLVLEWHSRWELDFDRATPRTLVLSPLVTRVDYVYYDSAAQQWQQQEQPRRGQGNRWEQPRALRLYFRHDRQASETVVPIPPRLPALPPF